MSNDSSMNYTEKIDAAKMILEHNIGLINLADTKASILLGVIGIMLVFLIEKVMPSDYGSGKNLLILVSIASLGLSAYYCVNTILPRVSQVSSSLIHLTNKNTELSQYIMQWKNLTHEQLLGDYLENIHSISIIRNRKYSLLRKSIFPFLISFIILIIYSVKDLVPIIL